METKEKRVYTIDDIAKELGVSKTTVSRAISGKGRISVETRKRVLAFIEEHDFQPNAMAKSLALSKTNNIGFVSPVDSGTEDLAFFRDCANGICEEAARNDYDVIVILEEKANNAQLKRVMNNRKVDGMIVARSDSASPTVPTLKENRFPFILLGESKDPDVICVDNNNHDACRDLVMLLIARGLRRIALFGGQRDFAVSGARYEGYAEALQQSGIKMDDRLVFWNVTTREAVLKAIDDSLREKADCIVCMDDSICHMTAVALVERGVELPGDMRLASFYDSALLENLFPPVTSLRFNAQELGRTACRELIKLMEGGEAQSKILDGYQMALRASTN